MKALANPPGGVKLTLEAICIMFEVGWSKGRGFDPR